MFLSLAHVKFLYFNQFKCPLSLGAFVIVVVAAAAVVAVVVVVVVVVAAAAVVVVVVVSLYCMFM